MEIRPFRREDASSLAGLSRDCARGESEFVLNPLWETEDELFAEFDRFGIEPEENLLVADSGERELLGLVGLVRRPKAAAAGMFAPIVRRGERGRGLGGELLRAGIALAESSGVKLLTAGIGTRNRAGYSLLTSHGFRPMSQTFLMRCNETPKEDEPPLEGMERELAGSDDAEAILAIYAQCGFEERGLEAMRAVMHGDRHVHAVARHDGRMLAFVELETHWPRRPWVAYVGVDPELRDRGVGSSLVAWAVRREFEQGAATSAQLMLSPANRTALRAYEKVGFRRARLIDVLEKGL